MCGASYPRFSLAWQIYIRDYLLQLEKKSGTVVDKLANLIGKEHDAVIVALACDVAFEFCHEGFYAQVDGVGSDFFADNIGGKRRHKFFAGFKDKVEFCGGKRDTFLFPVEAHFCNFLLKLGKLAFFVEHFLEVLSQSKIDAVVAAHTVELVPEHIDEHAVVSTLYVVNRTDIEKNCINFGRVEP